MSRFREFISRTLEKEAAAFPTEASKEKVPTAEAAKRAEELWALWRDFQKAPPEKKDALRKAIAERWHAADVRAVFDAALGSASAEFQKVRPDYMAYRRAERASDAAKSRRDALYRNIFTHRGEEPDELTLLELAETRGVVESSTHTLRATEHANPDLSARLSFDRLTTYRAELAKGFIWTPSREKIFDQILEHLVVLDQNRPLLLYGETGTGKTRLVRAAAERLTGQSAFEVGEEAKTDIRPLLGSPQFDPKEGSYTSYGALGQALTGKRTSLDQSAGPGGLFFMDEMNGYEPDALRSLIKQLSGRKPGEEVSFAAWRGAREKVSPRFGFIGSANLQSEKHPDRAALPPELARELGSLEVDYPPQSAEDPELYEMMLASLMDANNRIRLPRAALAPEWKEIVSSDSTVKSFEVDTDPSSGGTLWRFANLVADIQKSYKGQENSLTPDKRDASYLRTAVIDPGLSLAWLAEYRKTSLRQGTTLHEFLAKKLENWRNQKTFPEEDRHLIKGFISTFHLDVPSEETAAEERAGAQTPLSPSEIGRLSPRVPRTPEAIKGAPPAEYKAYLPDGTEVIYEKKPVAGFTPDTRLKKKTSTAKQIFLYKGLTADHQAVLEVVGGVILVPAADLARQYEKAELKGEALERELRDRFKENFLGISELERAFTLQNGSKLIELSPADREAAYRSLESKLNEPDIKEFLKHLTPESAKDWLLVLRVPKFKDGPALTMKALETRLAPDMASQNQGKLLYKVDWYATEDFYTNQTPESGPHWQFVTKKLVPDTKGKTHPNQTLELEKAARSVHLDFTKTRRRTPVETLFDSAAYFRATGERILTDEWDWSDVRSSDGRLVFVGDAGAGGSIVSGYPPSGSGGRLGASLSR